MRVRLLLAATLLGASAVQGFAQTPATPPPPATPMTEAAAPAKPPEPPKPNDYGRADTWLCRPGRIDACTNTSLSATIVSEDGSVRAEPFKAAANPPVDCFYVYPTVSTQTTPNSDMRPTAAEQSVVTAQFARFGSACRLFAPMYRQVTLSALRTAMTGKPNPGDPQLAYNDVRDAWKHYLAHDNNGRGVILIGHSQGTRHLTQLIREEIENHPAQARIIAAYLLGGQVTVAQGADAGGSFASMPLCRSAAQTGCVVAYNSFREESPPPADSRYGRAAVGQMTACVSPAALVNGGTELDAYLPSVNAFTGIGSGAPDWAGQGTKIATPFVRLPGLIHGQCVTSNGDAYLSIRLEPGKGPRTKTIPGDILIGKTVLKSWGLHLIDVNLTEGDLIALAGRQSQAWLAKR